MANQINPNLLKNKVFIKQALDSQNDIEKIKTERGFLGSIWGSSEKIPNNIAALSIVVLLFAGLAYTYNNLGISNEKISLSTKDFWAIISPLITLAIGYLFGDKTNNKNE